jgi:predicted Rdx family selenoprotein
MATEIFHEFEAEAPVTLIPVGGGRLEVYANGEKLFDRKAEGGAYPEMKRVREIKREIQKRIEALPD